MSGHVIFKIMLTKMDIFEDIKKKDINLLVEKLRALLYFMINNANR